MIRNKLQATLFIVTMAFGALSAQSVIADLIFGTPIELGSPINDFFQEGSTSISSDNLELYYMSDRNGEFATFAIRRESVSAPWSTPEFVTTAIHPELSYDGLSLYGNDVGQFGRQDLFVLERPTLSDPWGPMVNLGPNINSATDDRWAETSPDGNSLYFNRGSNNDPWEIWVSSRPDAFSPFDPANKLPPIINDGGADSPTISPDGLSFIFSSDRPGGYGQEDLWMSTRATTTADWSEPVNLGPDINSPNIEWQPDISPDGKTIRYARAPSTNGDYNTWQASIEDTNKPDTFSLVVPNAAADTEGDSIIPTNGKTNPFRQQTLYHASEFESLPNEQWQIVGYRLRADITAIGSAIVSSLTPSTIRLSTTEASSLSTTFANNVGSDETVVFDGPYSIERASNGPVGGPNEFDNETLFFQTPFAYDPADGNLLMDFATTSGFADSLQLDAQLTPGITDVASSNVESEFAEFTNTRALVVEFMFESLNSFTLNGGGETYTQDFDEMETGRRLPSGWSGVTGDGIKNTAVGLGLTDGFLTVPGSPNDGVLGVLNLGGNSESFGPAPDGFIPTWTAELGGQNDRFGRDDVIADNASDRAFGVSRESNDDIGQLNFEIEIADETLRAFVLDWDLEIWGGDPDADFRSPEGPGMKVDVSVGGNSYHTIAENLLPGTNFDSSEDESGSDHNATLIDGNIHSVRNISSGIKEVSDADGAVGNMVQINFNSNWNDATDGANGWFTAIDNVRLRALAPGDADANGVVDVADLLTLLGGQKFNQGVDNVTWAQGDFNADDQFNTSDLLAMLAFLSGTFPSDPYASEAGASIDAVADVIVNSETGEVTVDLAGHTVSAVIIKSAAEIFNGTQPDWDTTSQFPSTLPGELGNVLFTSTASGVDELGVVISAEFLGRDKEFYLQDLDLNILIASEGGALTKGNVIVVPEPSTWLLLFTGMLLVGWRQVATRRSPGKQ